MGRWGVVVPVSEGTLRGHLKGRLSDCGNASTLLEAVFVAET